MSDDFTAPLNMVEEYARTQRADRAAQRAYDRWRRRRAPDFYAVKMAEQAWKATYEAAPEPPPTPEKWSQDPL